MKYISFRAKGRDGKWWYGQTDEGNIKKREVNLATFFMHLYALDLDPKTLGQYVGIKGADGNRLFAGDIIQDCNNIKYVIEYDNASLTWYAWDYKAWWKGYYDAYIPLKDMDSIVREDCTPPCVPELQFHSLNSVGNIYDNPDNILICSACEYLNKCEGDTQKPDYCPLGKAKGRYWHGIMPV